MSAENIPKIVRDQFEDYAYKQYQTSRMATLLKNGREALTPADQESPVPRHEYFATGLNGAYKREAVALMWVGWKLCLDAQAPHLEAASLWVSWVDAQDRAAEELPDGYEIHWSIDKLEADKEGSGLVSMSLVKWPLQWTHGCDVDYIEFGDPADMDSPGMFVRMFESALQAAKDHHAKGLN